MITELRAAAQITPKKLSFNQGGKPENPGLELEVFDWVMSQREQELAVFTADIIDLAVHLCLLLRTEMNHI